MSLEVSKTKHGSFELLAQRDWRGQISQYNIEREKQEEREIELTWLREMGGGRSLQSQEGFTPWATPGSQALCMSVVPLLFSHSP